MPLEACPTQPATAESKTNPKLHTSGMVLPHLHQMPETQKSDHSQRTAWDFQRSRFNSIEIPIYWWLSHTKSPYLWSRNRLPQNLVSPPRCCQAERPGDQHGRSFIPFGASANSHGFVLRLILEAYMLTSPISGFESSLHVWIVRSQVSVAQIYWQHRGINDFKSGPIAPREWNLQYWESLEILKQWLLQGAAELQKRGNYVELWFYTSKFCLINHLDSRHMFVWTVNSVQPVPESALHAHNGLKRLESRPALCIDSAPSQSMWLEYLGTHFPTKSASWLSQLIDCPHARYYNKCAASPNFTNGSNVLPTVFTGSITCWKKHKTTFNWVPRAGPAQ